MVGTATTARLPDTGRFVALDSLRGVAALLVAAFHLQGTGLLFGSPFARSGWQAVDFFFVLSGFVIAASYGARLSSGFPIRQYAVLRLGRLYPLHLAMLIAFAAIEATQWLSRVPGLTTREPFTGGHSLTELGLSLFLLQGFEDPMTSDWNGPSWSISVEIWLYVMIALVWRAFGTRGWIVAAIAAGAAAYLLTFHADWLATPISENMLRGVLGFGTGVLAWQLWRGGLLQIRAGWVATMLEVAILAVVAVVIFVSATYVGYETVAALVFALAVLIFAGEGGLVSRLLRRAPFVWLGILSYSIYMVHGLVVGRGKDVARLAGFDPTSDLIGFAALVASVAVAYFAWRWIEEPARLWSRRRAARMDAAREEAASPTF